MGTSDAAVIGREAETGLEEIEPREMGPKTSALFDFLTGRVIGQDRIARHLAQGFTVFNAGLKDPRLPIFVGLLAGPTGTGKTMTAEELARFLIADQPHAPLTRIACTKLKQSHEVTSLTGAPPSYVGFDRPSLLQQAKIDEAHFWAKIRANKAAAKSLAEARGKGDKDHYNAVSAELYAKFRPYQSVILFDEIEKAHPDIWNVLLNISSDGELRMNDGSLTSFANSVILLTCNVGGRDQQERLKHGKLGFATASLDDERAQTDQELYELTKQRIEDTFPPEFIGRIRDEILVFRPLNRDDVRRALLVRYEEVRQRINSRKGVPDVDISFSDEFTDFMIDEGYDRQYGMRPLNQAVRRHILAPLASAIEAEDVKGGDEIVLTVSKADGKRKTRICRRVRSALFLPDGFDSGTGGDGK